MTHIILSLGLNFINVFFIKDFNKEERRAPEMGKLSLYPHVLPMSH